MGSKDVGAELTSKMFLLSAIIGLALQNHFVQAATLLTGGTVIAWNEASQSLEVVRNGSVLVEDGTIAAVFSDQYDGTLPTDLETIDTTNDIVSTGFIDTHRHSWQTAFKTLGSNTTLLSYLPRFGTSSPAGTTFTSEDVYVGQLAGLYEALNGGVTTIVDFAHCVWSAAHARAALNADLESGIRAVYAYNFGDYSFTNFTFNAQVELFKDLLDEPRLAKSSVEIGISYDGFSGSNTNQTRTVLDLATQHKTSLITTHANGDVYGSANFPSVLNTLGFLNQSIPLIFVHASYLSVTDAQLLRQYDHYISITPESEMHYGHLHPYSHLILDQASLGVDTHFTFSTDILTQARIWLQDVRKTLYGEVLERRRAPANNPMSVNQAFLLATRSGGLAMRRPDLGVLAPGAKADLVVWNGRSPSMLGWRDPVAAVMLHASVGDVKHVMVNGQFVKRDGQLTAQDYAGLQERFLQSAERIQDTWAGMSMPVSEGETSSGVAYERTLEADVERGDETGYGPLFV